MFYLAQGISVIALILAVISMQCKNKKIIMLLQFPSNILYSISNFLLGAIAGGITVLFASIRSFTIVLFENKKMQYSIWLYLFFQLAIIITSGIVWAGPMTLLSMMAGLIYNHGFCLEREVRLRYFVIGAAIMNIIYNILYAGYINALIELITLISALIFVIVNYINNKKIKNLI